MIQEVNISPIKKTKWLLEEYFYDHIFWAEIAI